MIIVISMIHNQENHLIKQITVQNKRRDSRCFSGQFIKVVFSIFLQYHSKNGVAIYLVVLLFEYGDNLSSPPVFLHLLANLY
jgi:hypothetical protein